MLNTPAYTLYPAARSHPTPQTPQPPHTLTPAAYTHCPRPTHPPWTASARSSPACSAAHSSPQCSATVREHGGGRGAKLLPGPSTKKAGPVGLPPLNQHTSPLTHTNGCRHPTLLAAQPRSLGAALAGELWADRLGGCSRTVSRLSAYESTQPHAYAYVGAAQLEVRLR